MDERIILEFLNEMKNRRLFEEINKEKNYEAYDIIVEDLKKQIPQEAEIESVNKGLNIMGDYDIEVRMLCPTCKRTIGDAETNDLFFKYCPICGQKLLRRE